MAGKSVTLLAENRKVLEVVDNPSVKRIIGYALARGVDVGYPVRIHGDWHVFEIAGDRLIEVVQGDSLFMRQLATEAVRVIMSFFAGCAPGRFVKRVRESLDKDVQNAVWDAFRALVDIGFWARKHCPERIVMVLKEV